MTHEKLISECTQWFWNSFPAERRMLYAINNNTSAGLSKQQSLIEGNKNKAKGVVKGVLDLCYLTPYGSCIYFDAKIGSDSLSHEQQDFCDKLDARRISWFLFSSFEEFKQLINTLKNG